MGTEFLFGVIKKLREIIVVVVVHNVLNATELDT